MCVLWVYFICSLFLKDLFSYTQEKDKERSVWDRNIVLIVSLLVFFIGLLIQAKQSNPFKLLKTFSPISHLLFCFLGSFLRLIFNLTHGDCASHRLPPAAVWHHVMCHLFTRAPDISVTLFFQALLRLTHLPWLLAFRPLPPVPLRFMPHSF